MAKKMVFGQCLSTSKKKIAEQKSAPRVRPSKSLMTQIRRSYLVPTEEVTRIRRRQESHDRRRVYARLCACNMEMSTAAIT